MDLEHENPHSGLLWGIEANFDFLLKGTWILSLKWPIVPYSKMLQQQTTTEPPRWSENKHKPNTTLCALIIDFSKQISDLSHEFLNQTTNRVR